MALKIWNIGKANTRIEELEAQNAALAKERDEARGAFEANSSEVSAGAEQLQKDLSTAKQTIGTLTGQVTAANAAVALKDAEIAALNARLSGQAEEMKVQVARQLANEQAKLGQPAVIAAPATSKTPANNSGMDRVASAAKADLEAAGYVRKN